ncbi:MAG: LysM peptidoglycan-binding domain-containing protein, partial [Cohaesibacteraceae bacterium]
SAEPQPSSQQQASPQRISVLDTGRVIIRRGDNLWRLSRRVYGQGVRFTSIYDANRDQIRDPALIFPGQVFELPTPLPDWGEVPGFEALEPDQLPPAADATSETTSG